MTSDREASVTRKYEGLEHCAHGHTLKLYSEAEEVLALMEGNERQGYGL